MLAGSCTIAFAYPAIFLVYWFGSFAIYWRCIHSTVITWQFSTCSSSHSAPLFLFEAALWGSLFEYWGPLALKAAGRLFIPTSMSSHGTMGCLDHSIFSLLRKRKLFLSSKTNLGNLILFCSIQIFLAYEEALTLCPTYQYYKCCVNINNIQIKWALIQTNWWKKSMLFITTTGSSVAFWVFRRMMVCMDMITLTVVFYWCFCID